MPDHLTQEYHDYLSSPEWQERRLEALQRAGRRCQICNSPSRLDVHHRTYSRFKQEKLEDLTVLCRTCHTKFHTDLPTKQRPKSPPKQDHASTSSFSAQNPETTALAASMLIRIIETLARRELSRRGKGRRPSKRPKSRAALNLFSRADWPPQVNDWKDMSDYLKKIGASRSEVSAIAGLWSTKCLAIADPARRLSNKIAQMEGTLKHLKTKHR